MTNFIKLVVVTSLLSILFSCGNNSTNKASIKKEQELIPTKENTANIVTKEGYCYYIPDSTVGKTYPLIILFTPHGKGKDAINKYIPLATNLDVIIVASLVSKNGMAIPEIEPHVKTMLQQITRELPVKKQQIILAGFSGGGRVALEMSKQIPNVVGVISCGAANTPNNNMKNAFLCGNRDFNYLEFVSVAMQTTSSNVSFYSFDGKHEWPEVDQMQRAIIFCLQNIPKSNFILSEEEKKFLMMEQQIRQELVQNFMRKDTNWWVEKINSLRTKAETTSKYEQEQSDRILAFIGMVCYSYAQNALRLEDIEAGNHILQIYEYIEPENQDMLAFKEQLTKLK